MNKEIEDKIKKTDFKNKEIEFIKKEEKEITNELKKDFIGAKNLKGRIRIIPR